MDVSVIEEALNINTSSSATVEQRDQAIAILNSYQADSSLILDTVKGFLDPSRSPQVRHFGLSSYRLVIKRYSGALDQQTASHLISLLIEMYPLVIASSEDYIKDTFASAFAELAFETWDSFWSNLRSDIISLFSSQNVNLAFNIVSETIELLSEKLSNHVTKAKRSSLIEFITSLMKDFCPFLTSALNSTDIQLISCSLRALLAFTQFISPMYIENNQLHILLVQVLRIPNFYIRTTAARILGECNRSQESTTLNALILSDLSYQMTEGSVITPLQTQIETHDYYLELCTSISSLFSTLPGNYLHNDLPDNTINTLFNFVIWLGKEHPSPLIFEASTPLLSTVSRDEVLAKRIFAISNQIINDIFILCHLNFLRRGDPSDPSDPAFDFMASKIQDTAEFIAWYSSYKQTVVDLTRSISGFFPRISLSASGFKLQEIFTKITSQSYPIDQSTNTIDQNSAIYKEFVQTTTFSQACFEGIVARSATLIGVTKSAWKKSFVFHDRDPFTNDVISLCDQILGMVLSYNFDDSVLVLEQIALVRSYTIYFIRCHNLFDKTLFFILNKVMFRMPSEKDVYPKMLSSDTLGARRSAVKTFINLCEDCPNFMTGNVQKLSEQINQAYSNNLVTEHEHEQILFGLATVILTFENDSGSQLIDQLFNHHISVLNSLSSCTDINSLCNILGYGLQPVPEQTWNLRRAIYYALEGLKNLLSLSRKTSFAYINQVAQLVAPSLMNFTSLMLNLYSSINHPILSLCLDEISRVMGRFNNSDFDKNISDVEADSRYLSQWSLDCLRNGLACLGPLSSINFEYVSSFSAILPTIIQKAPIWVLRYLVRDFLLPFFGNCTINMKFEPIIILLESLMFRVFAEYNAARERLKVKAESMSGLADEVFIDKVLAELTTEVSKSFSAVMGTLKKDNIATKDNFSALWYNQSPLRAKYLELISAIFSVPSPSPAKHVIQPIRVNMDMFKVLSTEQELNSAMLIWSSLVSNMFDGFSSDVSSEAITLFIQLFITLASLGLNDQLTASLMDLPNATIELMSQLVAAVSSGNERAAKPIVTKILAECGVVFNTKKKAALRNVSALAFNPKSRAAERMLSDMNSWTSTDGDLGLGSLYY